MCLYALPRFCSEDSFDDIVLLPFLVKVGFFFVDLSKKNSLGFAPATLNLLSFICQVNTLYFIFYKNTNINIKLKEKYMTTATSIFNSMRQSINESVIDDLTTLGFAHEDAIKVVVDSDDFDIVASGLENPVAQF